MIKARFIIEKSAYDGKYQHFQHRQGRQLLSELLSQQFGIEFSEDLLSFTEKGKPYIENGPKFSISHCDGLLCCAVSSRNETGIDCEKKRRFSERVARRCFSDYEILQLQKSTDRDMSFTMLWTLKEAYSKMTGEGVSSDLRKISFDLSDGKALFESGCNFSAYVINESFVISVCEKTHNAAGKIKMEYVKTAIDKCDILL